MANLCKLQHALLSYYLLYCFRLQGECLNRFRVIVAAYKPSLLNTCQHYNQEDFTFREKSFQRALLVN